MTTSTSLSSPFSRACLVAYTVLIVYASCYPFSGWQFQNLVAYTEHIQQWPHYWSRFDASINVAAYIPLGILVSFSLHPILPRRWSWLLALFAGAALSLSMESIQYFIPSRVTSLLDLLTNTLGTLIGAAIGATLIPAFLERDKLHTLRRHWLQRDSSQELVVLGLWPLAQIFPQAFLFGLGQILPVISLWCEEYLEFSIDLSSVLRNGIVLSSEEYLLTETIITASGCAGAILFFLSLFNRRAPHFFLALGMLVAALLTKTLATAVMFQPENAFSWLTPGAQGGIAISALILYGFSFAPLQAQRRLATLLLFISLLLVNLIPNNPYFLMTLQGLMQGKMLNFFGAAQFLAIVWPFVAIWYLLKK